MKILNVTFIVLVLTLIFISGIVLSSSLLITPAKGTPIINNLKPKTKSKVTTKSKVKTNPKPKAKAIKPKPTKVIVKAPSCIVVISGKRYDVIRLRRTHSGGDVFTCNTDMTNTYFSKHNTFLLSTTMQQYLVQ